MWIVAAETLFNTFIQAFSLEFQIIIISIINYIRTIIRVVINIDGINIDGSILYYCTIILYFYATPIC